MNPWSYHFVLSGVTLIKENENGEPTSNYRWSWLYICVFFLQLCINYLGRLNLPVWVELWVMKVEKPDDSSLESLWYICIVFFCN